MDDYIDYNGGYPDAANAMLGEQAASQAYLQPPAPPLSDATRAIIYQPLPAPGACDVKPRLNKVQHDFLEAEFQKHPKPSTSTKKEFAGTLNVTLEKVNNWFQNRRAKNKHDAKKMAAAYNLFQSNVNNSDTEPSPYQPSNEYAAMMQHLGQEELLPTGLPIPQHQQPPQHVDGPPVTDYLQDPASLQHLGNFNWEIPPPADAGAYDSSIDINRRTLTQEAFDAISRNGGMMNGHGQFEGLQAGFSGDQDMMNQIFGHPTDQHLKQQDLTFPYPVGAPMSSNDSTIPSVVSDGSYQFPVQNSMQNQHNPSVSDSEWTDSRSSSLSVQQHSMPVTEMAPPPTHIPTTNSQWQPGSSVPVDVNKHLEEFRQAAQARAADQQVFEQPLAFPSDAAYARRASQASLLTQSMGNVNIHTPQPDQSGVFKSPAPLSSIAARRQRPRPANLGVAALRSASYSGAAGQPGSPGHAVPQSHLTQDQQIRRIRSAAVLNGGVAHGRVMKSTPGSAQRSPVNWTFSNGMVSPNFTRTMSHGNLAPPTPMSPHEYAAHYEQLIQQQHANMTQHQNISETDLEYSLPFHPSASVPPQNFSSPPHTPMYHEHAFASQRMNGHVIPENTPPQSAPAGQTCFPSNIFTSTPQHPSHYHSNSIQAQMQAPPVMQRPVPPPAPVHASAPVPVPAPIEQPQPVSQPTVTFAPSQQSNVTTGPPPGIPLQFANGIPTVTAEGTAKISFPPQAQLMQQQSSQMGTPPQQQYAFVTTSGASPSALSATGTPQQRGELFVHEYSPPDGMKRAVTPRKTSDAAPKSFTFTNQGPVDFEEKSRTKKAGEMGREGSLSSGWSPASSSSGSASTS